MATTRNAVSAFIARPRTQDFLVGASIAFTISVLVGLIGFSILRNIAQTGSMAGVAAFFYFAQYFVLAIIVVLAGTFGSIVFLRPGLFANLGAIMFFLLFLSPIPLWVFNAAVAAVSLASQVFQHR
jgi:hypothetical protein